MGLCLLFILSPGQALTGAQLKASRAGSRLADAHGVYNSFIAAQVAPDGTFNFGAFPGGGSNVAGSSSFNLSFAWPNEPGTSFTTLRLDGADLVLGRDIPVSGTQTDGDTSTTLYQHGPLTILQELTLVTGLASGRPDAVRIRYEIGNGDALSHEIGLRIMVDTMLNSNDAAPFRVPGVGAVTTERLFTGADIPPFWQAFASLSDPTIAARGDLTGGGATRPDRFGIGNWGRLQSEVFDWTPNLGQETGDSGIAIWWDPVPVRSGERFDRSTFYGLGDQTVNQGGLLLGVTAPAEYEPQQADPLTIVATIENPSPQSIPGVLAQLDLPDEFALVSRATAQALLGDLGPGEARQVTWEVASTGALQPGEYRFTVTASSSDNQVQPVSVQRTVRVGVPPSPQSAVAQQSTIAAVADDLLDPGADLAVRGEPLRIQIVARDAEGRPVAGVEPSRLTLLAEPAAGLVIQPLLTPTDAQGVTVATVTPQADGYLELGLEVDGVRSPSTVVLNVTAARRATVTYDLAAGIHLLSLPLLRPDLLDDDTWRDIELLTWDAENEAYRRIGAESVRPTDGFFARLASPRRLEISGYAPLAEPDGPPLELTTFGGGSVSRLPADYIFAASDFRLRGEWNLLGNPSHLPLPWLFDRFQVVVDGAVVGPLSDPATWEYVDPYVYVFDGRQYRLVFDGRYPGFENTLHEIPILQGFWMHRKPGPLGVSLRLAPPDSLAPRSVASGWAVPVIASSGDLRDEVVVGGGRRLSLLEPPAAGSGLSFTLLDGAIRLGGQLREAGPFIWEAEVTAPPGEVMVSWPSLGRNLPGGYSAVLIDRETGRRTAMRGSAAFRFTSDGSPRRVALEFAPASGTRLQVQVQANPTRSRAASFTLLLTAPATVRVEVTGLGGRVVRELSETAGADATVVGWDGLDQHGRRVPAGVYQVRVAARGDDGEVARAISTVAIR